MNMVAVTPIANGQQAFECLRCGHAEKRKSEEP
jgi:Zn ribbon nucleic-acid-binding protein